MCSPLSSPAIGYVQHSQQGLCILPCGAEYDLCQAGLKLLMDDGNVLKCWDDRLDAIYHAELGASAAILRAGFNLDCLLTRCGAPTTLQARAAVGAP